MRNVVIIGCGFAGYHAARQLEDDLTGRRQVQLTIICRRAHFVFTPLLCEVASGALAPEHITTPIDDAVQPRTQLVIDEVEKIDFATSRIHTERRTLPFDYLLIAHGSQPNPTAFDGAARLDGPHTLSDAVQIRDELTEHGTANGRPLRFAVIGGGSTGVEWACELATTLAEDFGLRPGCDDVTIDLFEVRGRLLADHSPQLSRRSAELVEQFGITPHTTCRVTSASPTHVVTDDGTRREYTGVFHCAGTTVTSLDDDSDVDQQGRLLVEDTLALSERHGVFVAGDAAAPFVDLPRRSDPQLALQQGEHAARNLLAAMSGRTLKPFQFESRGDFVMFGRHHAALELGGLLLEGRPAWLAHRLYYTALMPHSIQKARLLVDWLTRRMGAHESPIFPKSLPDDSDD